MSAAFIDEQHHGALANLGFRRKPQASQENTMTASIEKIKKLREPFSASNISWRLGMTNPDKTLGQALPYLDNRNVQNRLDEVLGAESWRNHFEEVIVGSKLVAVRCIISLKIDGEWIAKEDAAPFDASGGLDYALKGVYSDAMKRAAVQWGIGRYLYAYQAPWIELDAHGRLTELPQLPDEFLPESEQGQARVAPAAPATPVAKPAAEPRTASAHVAPASRAVPEAKPEPAPAAHDETGEVAREAVRESARQAAPEAAAPEQASAPVTRQVRDEDRSRAFADSVVDSHQAAAQVLTPEPAPVARTAPAADGAESSGDELPEGLSDEQKALVTDLLGKLQKLPPKMIRAYLAGPKSQGKLNETARQFLLRKVEEKEASA